MPARGSLLRSLLLAFETYPLLRERIVMQGTDGLTGIWRQTRTTAAVRVAIEHLPIRCERLVVEKQRRLQVAPRCAAPDLSQLLAIRKPSIPVPSTAIRRLQAGGTLIDCVVLPHSLLRAWLGLSASNLELAQLGHDIVAHWLARGVYDLEQWFCQDRTSLVTFGRTRPEAC